MNLLLKNLQWMRGTTREKGDVRISLGQIREMGVDLQPQRKDRIIRFDNHFLYRGLINSHDHLEMNLYANLGRPPYQNYTQWGKDVYLPRESPVKEIETIPLNDRLTWGGIKNLISGVTTVVHHNPFYRSLQSKSFPLHVFQEYAWAHSLAFDKEVARKFPKNPTRPFIIHAAEGIDDFAQAEIRKLQDLNVLKSNTVLVHAVGLTERDRAAIHESQASIVWCPSSNLFMFNQTANITSIKEKIKVALGSDSTMTGRATFFEEMRVALDTMKVSAREIVDMVTLIPEKIFRLPSAGLEVGQVADLLILPIQGSDYHENLILSSSEQVSAVLVKGEMHFGDIDIANELGLGKCITRVGTKTKWIAFDVKKLMSKISSKTGKAFFRRNPLWNLLES